MSKPLPPPPESDTAEEVREYYRDVERAREGEYLDQPRPGEN